MVVRNQKGPQAPKGALPTKPEDKCGPGRLARELLTGRYQPGESIQLPKIAKTCGVDQEVLQKIFSEFQTLGMVKLSGQSTAVVCSPDPKEMHQVYEIRAALEEIGGRAAAPAFSSNTSQLQIELEAMRNAVRQDDLDSYAEHDVRFHRTILQASQNEVLLRVWDTLGIDLRMRAAVGKVTRNLPEVVGSHQPIIDALHRGQANEAGLLLRNHIETFLQFLKKADSDSGTHRAVYQDLQSAKDVQTALFPQNNISIPGLSCQTFYKPARSIGGDYYDFFPLKDDRWGIAIGDVSGKGIGAALIMASLQASLRSQALHEHSDLAALMADVDRLVFASSPVHIYASLFYAEFHPATHVLEYANAGHNAPLVLRWEDDACQVFQLQAGGTPVALLEGSQFVAGKFQFEAGDVLVAYTDGITESDNAAGEMWGVERLANLLRTCRDKSAEEIIQCILDERFVFANGQPQRDDMTLVVMRVQG
jgi:serine phosphatase RsbU (regulator of sigma subunit)